MMEARRFIRNRMVLAAALALGSSLVVAQPLPQASPESVGMSSERLQKITNALQGEVRDKKLPGAVVMVARKGKLVYSQAVGDVSSGGGAKRRRPLEHLVGPHVVYAHLKSASMTRMPISRPRMWINTSIARF